jgi:hypothetical protein
MASNRRTPESRGVPPALRDGIAVPPRGAIVIDERPAAGKFASRTNAKLAREKTVPDKQVWMRCQVNPDTIDRWQGPSEGEAA